MILKTLRHFLALMKHWILITADSILTCSSSSALETSASDALNCTIFWFLETGFSVCVETVLLSKNLKLDFYGIFNWFVCKNNLPVDSGFVDSILFFFSRFCFFFLFCFGLGYISKVNKTKIHCFFFKYLDSYIKVYTT